ncbi:2'-5' RNA ligase family protein [Arthrobacter oryzae]|uniref:2'-5' RNA ligase family protein n=1 Tax=Arthrobacter oryzae TaxID=409290 RepID=UPI0027805FBD|nr:2'-5' RNA ligase family protein [Arthrobacter oryzae]MDQ0076313.1 2'-5' RNA ligase [Arthrobacter oryzae]
MPRSFMSGPDQLSSLEGQQYVVLRPSASVMAMYERVQATAQSSLPDVVTYPHTGHVTLRGFSEPDRVEHLKEVIREWAADQSFIDLRLDAIDSFPAPFQIVIARLERTPSLVEAYAGLTEMLDETDFNRIGELSLEDWTFHMSIAYCGELPDDDWEVARTTLERELAERPMDEASEVEFVWYQSGVEHREIIAFARTKAASSSAGVVP